MHAVRKSWFPGNVQGPWARALSIGHVSSPSLWWEDMVLSEFDLSKMLMWDAMGTAWGQLSEFWLTAKTKTQQVALHKSQTRNDSFWQFVTPRNLNGFSLNRRSHFPLKNFQFEVLVSYLMSILIEREKNNKATSCFSILVSVR